MPDNKLINIILGGAESWNSWYSANPSETIDLEGAILRGLNLKGICLEWANLKNAVLDRADLNNASLA